jgi:hypothetical protein
MSDSTRRFAGLYAAVAAALAVLLAPLLAMSYFATSHGAEELERGSVSAWAEPGRDLAGGLLTWASPERVYSTYVQAFAILFAGVVLGALAIRAGRPPSDGGERWGWRIALTGYGLAAAGLAGAVLALVPGDPDSAALNVVFLALLLPGMFVSVIGSTVLGIAFLRRGYRPRLTSLLLTLAFPSMVAVPTLLGHNSLGMLPLMLAWGASGLALRRAPGGPHAAARAPVGVRAPG